MKLSILIVNWNSKDYLRECLRTVRKTCADLDPQVVVVDGGSFDGSAEMLAADFPEVDFVQSPDNIGFGRSNNLGFTKVTGDLVLLLNPDTELKPGAVASLIRSLQELPDAGLIGARLLNSDGSLQFSSVHSLPTPWNVAFDSDWGRRRWWQRQGPPAGGDPREVEAVSGACMLLRAEDFRRLGGFDPRYFMYAEDMDLCFRLRQTCGRIYHDPRAEVLHHGGGSSRTQFSKFSAVMIREAVRVYIETHHGKSQVVLYRLLMALSASARMAFLAAFWLVSSGERRTACRVSILKWLSVFRWALGKETWASARFETPRLLVCEDPAV